VAQDIKYADMCIHIICCVLGYGTSQIYECCHDFVYRCYEYQIIASMLILILILILIVMSWGMGHLKYTNAVMIFFIDVTSTK